MIAAKTIVTTVEGRVVEFGGWSAKFIVTHPRLSFWIGVGLGVVADHLILVHLF